MRYPLALALTLAVEVPVYVIALRTITIPAGPISAGKIPISRAAAVAVGVNLVTHPLVWLAVSHAGAAYWPVFAAAELGAWLAEAALIYAWVRRDGPLVGLAVPVGLVALVANAGSALAGLLAVSPWLPWGYAGGP